MNKPKKYKNGGLSRSEDFGSTKKPYPSVKSNDFAGGNRSYPIPTKADAVDALRLAGLHSRGDVKAKVYSKYPDLKKAKGGYVEEYGLGGLFKKGFNFAKDFAIGRVDNVLGLVGAGNVIKDTAYSSQKAADINNKIGSMNKFVANTALNAFVPGSGAALGALQNAGENLVTDTTKEDAAADEALEIQRAKQATMASFNDNYNPVGQYAPTFSRGGRMKYPTGGETDDPQYDKFQKEVPKSEITNNNARLYAYKQMLDKALSAKNKSLYDELNSNIEGKDAKARLAYADSIAKANPNFALSVDEQRSALGSDYDDFNALRTWRLKNYNAFGNNASVAGSNEESEAADTAYGARNSAFYSPAYHKRNAIISGKAVADYTATATYDPATKTYSYTYDRKPIMAHGGLIRPNAELEKGEPFRTPDGQIGMVSNEAPTHAEGGVPMNLPSGTEILGKNTAPNGEMFKTIGQKLKKAQDRYQKVLANRPTEIAKRTAKMMLDKVQKEYDSLFEEQELAKEQPISNQFAWGGKTNPAQSQYEQELAYSNGSQSSGNGLNLKGIAGTIGEYAPIAYNILTGLKKPKQLDAEQFQNPYESSSLGLLKNMKYDPNAELTSNRNELATYNRSVRGLGLSGGQVASNLAAGSINKMRADSDALTRANRINNEYAGQYANALGQFGQQRASTNLAIDDINTREKASREAALQAGLSQLSQATQAGKLRNNMILRDAQRLGLLDSLVQNYTLTSDGKWVSKATGQSMTSNDMMKFIKGN